MQMHEKEKKKGHIHVCVLWIQNEWRIKNMLKNPKQSGRIAVQYNAEIRHDYECPDYGVRNFLPPEAQGETFQ